MTEKYLDFSFEKTNSAYMLFYEWRSGKGEQRNHSESPTSMSSSSSMSQFQESGKLEDPQASTSDHVMVTDENVDTNSFHNELVPFCDSEIKTATTSRKTDEDELPKSPSSSKLKRKSLLNKELEDWIWQDNRHYLEDRNIFEHTYFK